MKQIRTIWPILPPFCHGCLSGGWQEINKKRHTWNTMPSTPLHQVPKSPRVNIAIIGKGNFSGHFSLASLAILCVSVMMASDNNWVLSADVEKWAWGVVAALQQYLKHHHLHVQQHHQHQQTTAISGAAESLNSNCNFNNKFNWNIVLSFISTSTSYWIL